MDSSQSIGPYTIIREIGRGGMGVVYLARDTKLDRDVAIKCLPDDLAADIERLTRFEREAKLLASISHGNIAAVHGLEEQDGKRYLVMEFVEGENLSERLARGKVPIDESLEIAVQIAQALEAAHDKGIIHRDLKPANIRVTPKGEVKVLDFGLAKRTGENPSSIANIEDSPTIVAVSPTMPGVILGTAGYLSPEQARGRPVDKRTDIFSFGCVLYELLTGVPPFPGETATDSIGATLHKDVALDQLPLDTPTMVRHTLIRCLERDRKKRLRDIGDARIELEFSLNSPEANKPIAASTTRSRRGFIVAFLVVVAIAIALVGLKFGQTMNASPPASVAYLTIPPPPGYQIRHSGDLSGPPVVSPDGAAVAFAAFASGETMRLWVRQLDEPDAREIPGTDGAMFPFWSPDSRSVGFFTRDKLRRVNLDTNTVISVCPVDEARGGAWTHDERMIFAPRFSSALMIVSDSGGDPIALTTYDREQHTTHRWPQALADGKHFLYFAGHRDPTRRDGQGIFLGTLDGKSEPRRLTRSNFGAQYVDGWLLMVRDDVLLASRVDLDNTRLTGQVQVVTRDIAVDQSTWHPQFSASAEGTLVFNRRVSGDEVNPSIRTSLTPSGSEADTLTVFDRTGRETTHIADGMPIESIALSPDGYELVLAVQTRDGTSDLWIYPTSFSPNPSDSEEKDRIAAIVMTPNPRRLTFLEGSESRAVWSPAGDEIAFARHDSSARTDGIYRKHIDGGPEELLLADPELSVYPLDWTRDGKYIIYKLGAWATEQIDDIWALPLGEGEPFLLVQSPVADLHARVSPDGRWLAFSSKQAVSQEVYVIPFTPAWPEAERSREWQVSLSGGRQPEWNNDGTELFFISDTGMLMSVKVNETEQTFEFERPVSLFQTPWDTAIQYAVYPPDDLDQHFVFMDTRQSPNTPISIILNWQQLLTENQSPRR
jgi:eukaryotic-like serine/threonine-protein kinase